MASAGIRKTRTGRYKVWWRLDDASQGSQTFDTRDQARDFKHDLLARLARGTWVDPRLGKQTFETWAREWWESWSADPDHSPTDPPGRRGASAAAPAAQPRPPTASRDHRQRRAPAGRTSCAATVGYDTVMACRSLLYRILQAAEDDRRIEANPVRKVPAPKPPVDPAALLGRAKRRAYTPEEFGYLLAGTPPFYRDHFITAGRDRPARRRAARPARPPRGPRAADSLRSWRSATTPAASAPATRTGPRARPASASSRSPARSPRPSPASSRRTPTPTRWCSPAPAAATACHAAPAAPCPATACCASTSTPCSAWPIRSRPCRTRRGESWPRCATAGRRRSSSSAGGCADARHDRRPSWPRSATLRDGGLAAEDPPGRWIACDPPSRDDLLGQLRLRGPHDLRHTFATWLEDAGIPARVIDELMGHAGGSAAGERPTRWQPDRHALPLDDPGDGGARGGRDRATVGRFVRGCWPNDHTDTRRRPSHRLTDAGQIQLRPHL